MGCSTATAPGAALTFSSSEPRTAGVVYPPPPPVARVATSAVTVTGTLVAGNPCHRLLAGSTLAGRVLTITVSAPSTVPPGGGCVQVVAAFDYTATVRGLSAGPLVLRVVHGGVTAPVLDDTVTIPR